MTTVVSAFDLLIAFLRPALFWIALVLAAVAVLDWLVRTRRINAFSPVARFARDVVDPMFKPVERRIVQAGGNPHTAPFWAAALAVLGGIVLLSVLQFVRGQLVMGVAASQAGARGVVAMILGWVFQVLRLALIVRVVCSWIRISPYSRWVRWAFILTEPILRPLRRIIPTLGMVDVTPIVAWLLLSLVEAFVVRSLG